jgi:hypothetical protein
LYQDVRFKIEQLQGMIHKMVEEARRDLMELLMLEMNAKGEVEEGQLLLINWNRLNDNASEEKVR